MRLIEFAELLDEQAKHKRNNKRAEGFADIPQAILVRLAAIARSLADTADGPATQPQLPEAPVISPENAAMQPIQPGKELAEAQSPAAAQAAYDLAKYGFRTPWPVDEAALIAAESSDPVLDYLTGEVEQYSPPPQPAAVEPSPSSAAGVVAGVAVNGSSYEAINCPHPFNAISVLNSGAKYCTHCHREVEPALPKA